MLDPQLTSFGIHQATFKDNLDPTYWATAKIVGSAEVDLKPELIKLTGGSALVPWAAAPGTASGEITLTIKQYDKDLLRFLAPWISTSEVESATGEASGSVTAITNAKGTSIVDEVTGIQSIAVGTASNLSPGNYKVVATGAATVDLYVDNDTTGQVEYQNSSLKINSAAITIPGSGSSVESQGIEFESGSGTIAFTTGDIATFTVNPISNYLLNSYFGKSGACSREFSFSVFSECVGGKLVRTDYPRCVASSTTAPMFLEKDFSSMEATIQVLQPANVDYVAETVFINR